MRSTGSSGRPSLPSSAFNDLGANRLDGGPRAESAWQPEYRLPSRRAGCACHLGPGRACAEPENSVSPLAAVPYGGRRRVRPADCPLRRGRSRVDVARLAGRSAGPRLRDRRTRQHHCAGRGPQSSGICLPDRVDHAT
jgi:hypothetical protein